METEYLMEEALSWIKEYLDNTTIEKIINGCKEKLKEDEEGIEATKDSENDFLNNVEYTKEQIACTEIINYLEPILKDRKKTEQYFKEHPNKRYYFGD